MMATDPICKMEVDETSEFVSIHNDQKYVFCSGECKKKFDELDKSVIRLRRFLKHQHGGRAKDKDRDQKGISFGHLYRDIIKPGICTQCGACIASCEVLRLEGGRPKLVGKCTACGVCYNQCPRTITTEAALVGRFREVLTARSGPKGIRGQDGGVISSLLLYALDEGLIDSAVVTATHPDEPWRPIPIIAKNRDDLMRASGSKYTHALTMDALFSTIKMGARSVAFVGNSCNIDAVHKMQTSPQGLLHLFMRANILKLGLFCMDTFDYDGMKAFFKGQGIALGEIEKMTIKKGKFVVETVAGKHVFDLGDFDGIRSSSCRYCTDFASENTDISFGGVGSKDGSTTVLVRSGIGYEIFHEAVDSGYIEADVLESAGLERVLNLAKAKKVQMYMFEKRKDKVKK